MEQIARTGPRIIAFLGSTIGNFDPHETRRFYRRVASLLGPEDRLLVGYDLVKNPAIIEAAYNDSAGITAEFNRNVLHVINRELGADFRVDRFEHVAEYNERSTRIESGLRASCPMTVRIPPIELELEIAGGELIRTEISTKYTREGVIADLEASDMRLEQWQTDSGRRFALGLSRTSAERHQ